MDNLDFSIGKREYLRNIEGEISFGWVLSGSVVSWSDANSKDLLISRCWQGMYLYPTSNFKDCEFEIDAKKIAGTFNCVCLIHCPVDWNKDGTEDIIAADRRGFLKLIERKGRYPNLEFIDRGYIKDKKTGLPFHLEFFNKQAGEISSEGGYVDPQFYNITYPICYPDETGDKKNLIIGDWGGNLWWMPDIGDEKAEYEGTPYEKDTERLVTDAAKEYVKKLGKRFVRPKERICDTNGNPIILGKGVNGDKTFDGSSARISLYWNKKSGMYDIIAIAGTKEMNIYYLRRTNRDGIKPVFENLGKVKIDGLGSSVFDVGTLNFHSKIIVDGKSQDICITTGSGIIRLKNKGKPGEKPVFETIRKIRGKEAITTGYNFTAMLKSKRTKEKYFIDTAGAKYFLRKIVKTKPKILVEDKNIPVATKEGEVFIPGETDSEGGKSWGFDRIHRWNYNGKGENSYIIGSDAGNLYLLEEDLNTKSENPLFALKGPLKDKNGDIIKIYNRVAAVGVSFDKSNVEDLFVGGSSYQMGIYLQKKPGAGFFRIKNYGVDNDGLPVLSRPKEINIENMDKKPSLNCNVMIQSYDIDNDGKKEIFIGIRKEGYKTRILKVKNKKLVYTGKDFPITLTHHYLHDIDDDNIAEVIHGGGEEGMAWYAKVKIEEKI